MQIREKPLLLVDIDGVLSIWGFDSNSRPEGAWAQVDGIAHFLSARAAVNLQGLQASFELAWCSGWEDRANDHLPHLIGVGPLPHLSFDPASTAGHWKLEAIDAYAGPQRPLAWIDDDFSPACHAWAAQRTGPTLLQDSDPAIGLDDGVARELRSWAERL